VQRFKAALNRAWQQRRPRPYRLSDALDFPGPEVLKLEQIAKQFSRALTDHDRVRLRNPLQTRRKVRGLADHRLFLRCTRTDQIADDD
jgi:hypothetical protein